MTTTASALTIDQLQHQIEDNQQLTQLAAPIRLVGEVDIERLIGDLSEHNCGITIGVDEAGRGPLLGDVVVAAAILPALWSGEIDSQPLVATPIESLTDSKKLSEKKREQLFALIKRHALGYVIAEVPAAVIDQVNILQATMLGMQLASEYLMQAVITSWPEKQPAIRQGMNSAEPVPIAIDIVVDGNRCPVLSCACFDTLEAFGVSRQQVSLVPWIKGDGRHTSIAAASVLAKVHRDALMLALAEQYPKYGIAKHKGYPTQAHIQAITEYGILPMHRRSFAPVRRALDTTYD